MIHDNKQKQQNCLNKRSMMLIKPISKASHLQSLPLQSNNSLKNEIKQKKMFIPQYTDRILLSPMRRKHNILSQKKMKSQIKQPNLKQIISQHKKNKIIKNFINIIGRNKINCRPVQYHPFQKDIEVSFIDSKGIQLNESVFITIAIFSVIQIIILSILYTLAIVFQEINTSQIVVICQTIGVIFYILQIIINFATVKLHQGKRLMTFRQIWTYYSKENLPIDILNIVILIIDLIGQINLTVYLRLFIILKLNQGLQKMQKLQILFISNFHYEQYWSLIKVFLFNFSFAHILAICLILMTMIDDSQNWMTEKGIADNPWYERYVWSYYWATTIMLTVGFGDIAASNYKQALVITFIQTISCIALAYNINCVGTLISNIRSQDLEKGKNFKIFRKLSQKNHVTQDLQWRINNYIEQSSKIKKKFNYEEENTFVQKLPNGLKKQFLKQSNKKIFQNLPFFKDLLQGTLFSFAQKIQMHICHPGQIIQHIDDPHNLMILKGGQIGFACKKAGCDFNQTIINTLRRNSMDQPFLISLGFIRQNRPIFEIQSLQYSILYFLQQDKIKLILKESQMDYQMFCFLKDKCSYIPDEYQLVDCQECKSKHTKFNCPKLHYIAIKTHIVTKQIYNAKIYKCKRIATNDSDKMRITRQKTSALKQYLSISRLNNNIILSSKVFKKSFNKNLIGTRKRFESIVQQPIQKQQEITKMQNIFYKSTANLIKHQIKKVLNSECFDQVWLIQSDRMKNYKFYFQNDNSCNLIDKQTINKKK